ncbi:SatD family protein [Herbiconiux sp. L3-i23]|uniref:SatD family protein n=1 Tax=Herbiconiux sp. L3-i23 TaxID=2905871 RepID=UPI0020602F1E|nr:SatD family protein [Herbiconiux sp. L3-i23]BDI22252.1 transcriptional regulator [Herbiconiux sp. L3-i23]
MFVLTADQVGSRHDRDRVPDVLRALDDIARDLVFPIERYAGDEIQVVARDASTALTVVERLTRGEHWRVGLGVGAATTPLPATASEATGDAFVRAREAVDAARRRVTRFALVGPPLDAEPDAQADPTAEQVEALVDLQLSLRSRRTPEGWEVSDLLAAGRSQREIAELLGVTPQAVSLRLKASGWRLEERARPALVLLLDGLDRGNRDQEGALDS